MIELKRFSLIMKSVTSLDNISGTDKQIEVVYDIFKGTSRYMSPRIHVLCTKTACDIAVHIIMTIKRNQTSVRFTVSDLIDSHYITSKSKSQLYDAINELIDKGVIARWRDIEEIPNRESIPKSWFLLNPQMLKCISCKAFKEQVETTIEYIENSKYYSVNEFSAIVYDFDRNKYKNTEESQFKNLVRYYD